ncbi:MAG TPA: Ku protein [Candidatus Dormibacteraeota bacterium]|nr:Ku protein [Candidatus Dormibacteraeota bacterium]
MARAMWKGAIQFGLVTIPVKLYLATESKSSISFNLLHEKDDSRIQMKIWCPEDEAIIPRSETVRGYEYAPDQYVVVTEEDLEKVPLKTVRSIEIEQFIERDGASADSPVRFVRQAYYVEPDRIARKAFALLREVLIEQGLTAICKVVIKDREVLASLDPFEDTMLLSTLHWPDEIRNVGELDMGDEKVEFKPAEKKMAAQLVAAMTGEFDPAQYRDEYREAVEQIIQAKVEGKETVAVAEPEPTGKLVDLMAALEASVNAAKASRSDAPVSVADAKKRKAATGQAKAAGEAARSAELEPEAEESRPARRRKTA